MTIMRLLAIRRMLFTLIDWVEEELRAKGWQRGHGEPTTTHDRSAP